MLEFVKNKLSDEYRYRCENKQMTPNTCETAYKLTNKANKNKKCCNFCKRVNHTTDECYHLKNKNQQNNYARNEWNKSRAYSNSNNLRNNETSHKNNHNNPRESSNFCLGSKEKQMII